MNDRPHRTRHARLARPLGALALLACSVATLTGCPNPNTYGVPRTVPRGEIQNTLAVEGGYLKGKSDPFESDSAYPLPPTYELRTGATDRIDFGVRIAHGSSLGADAKWNFLRSRFFDLALDPGFQASGYPTIDSGVGLFYMHLPALIGVNLGDHFTVVASPGLVQAIAIGDTSSTGQERVGAASLSFYRMGLGLNARLARTFALHPEVTVMRSLDSADATMLAGGLGFKFGAMPDYSHD